MQLYPHGWEQTDKGTLYAVYADGHLVGVHETEAAAIDDAKRRKAAEVPSGGEYRPSAYAVMAETPIHPGDRIADNMHCVWAIQQQAYALDMAGDVDP